MIIPAAPPAGHPTDLVPGTFYFRALPGDTFVTPPSNPLAGTQSWMFNPPRIGAWPEAPPPPPPPPPPAIPQTGHFLTANGEFWFSAEGPRLNGSILQPPANPQPMIYNSQGSQISQAPTASSSAATPPVFTAGGPQVTASIQASANGPPPTWRVIPQGQDGVYSGQAPTMVWRMA